MFSIQQAAGNMTIRKKYGLSKSEDFKTALQIILQG